MGDVSLLKMRMEGQSLLDSGESSAAKYSSRVGRARLANQKAHKQARSTATTALAAPPSPPSPSPPSPSLPQTSLLPPSPLLPGQCPTRPAGAATPPFRVQRPSSLQACVRPLPPTVTHSHILTSIRPHTDPPCAVCRKWASSLSGLTTLLWSSRAERPPLVSLQLASCACSGRPCRLWAVQRSQEEAGPLPLVLERAASKSRRFHRL